MCGGFFEHSGFAGHDKDDIECMVGTIMRLLIMAVEDILDFVDMVEIVNMVDLTDMVGSSIAVLQLFSIISYKGYHS